MAIAHSKSEWGLIIGELAGDICGLDETEISDAHPKVRKLHEAVEVYETLYGTSVVSLILKSEYCFEDAYLRLSLLKQAWKLSVEKTDKDQDYVIEAFRDFKTDIVSDSLSDGLQVLIDQLHDQMENRNTQP